MGNAQGIKLTKQQLEIIGSVKDNEFTRVNAFAGTGKTTVLLEMTKAYPDKTFLYLVFNKAMADEAKAKFGDNTKVCTVNSLAYQATKRELGLFNVRPNYRVVEIKEHYNMKRTESTLAYCIILLFDAYCNSAYSNFTNEVMAKLIRNNAELSVIFSQRKPLESKVVDGVKRMWVDMYNGDLEITHGFYLKYFQLAIERFRETIKYDFIALDECQDTNSITLDIFKNLNGNKIIVGDKWQQIYGFRGTVNAMSQFDEVTNDCLLTHTFRFNQKIADNANFVLNSILGEKHKIIPEFPDKDGDIKTRCHITRTNAGIIELFSEFYESGQIVKTIRQPSEIFKLPNSLYYYLTDKNKYRDQIEVKWLYNFNGINEIKEYAEDMNDIEMKSSIRIVEKYWDEIIDIFNQAKDNRRKKKVDVYLTTAHTCKGLEWDEVFIANDFQDLLFNTAFIASSLEEFHRRIREDRKQNSNVQKVQEEWNLFYVAMTRGINKVHLSLPNSSIIGMPTSEIDNMLHEYHQQIMAGKKRPAKID